jgi:hypothetical protein
MSDKDTAELVSYGSPPPGLFSLPRAASRYGLPDGYEKAHLVFESAEHDFKAGKHAQAAKKFISAAEQVKAPDAPTTYSSQFAKMRAAAYQNAAIAFGLAGLAAEGKKALAAAKKHDAENANELDALAASLK